MIRLALVFTLALALTVTASAQTYSVPRQLPLEAAVKREFRKWMITAARFPGLIPEEFYPIGWSKDGKFAYYYEPVDEACGCYFANLVIQDMRTDKVLWEFKFRGDDSADPKTGEMPPEDTIQELWKKNIRLFSEELREHGIVAAQSVLSPKTFTAGGRSYTARGRLKMGKNPDYGEDRVDRFTITLTSPKLGTKTLGSIDHSSEEYWFSLDAAILGVIKSPFEPRVAVIGMEVNRGWEGPPHTGNIHVVGADLRKW